MFRNIFFLCLLIKIIINIDVSAQSESSNYYLGEKNGLQFSDTGVLIYHLFKPTPLTNVNSLASISDGEGNLIFYTDGDNIWNYKHESIHIGNSGIKPNYSTVIVSKPKSNGLFYVITVKNADRYYEYSFAVVTEVDMTLNDGTGDVTNVLNIPLSSDTVRCAEVIKHDNGKDYWLLLLSHSLSSSHRTKIYAHKITSTGISLTPTISTFPYLLPDDSLYYFPNRSMRVSPDGSKIIFNLHRSFVLGDFINSTGKVENIRLLETGVQHISEEFSPNSNFIYVIDYHKGKGSSIYQYNIQQDVQEMMNSKSQVFFNPNNVGPFSVTSGIIKNLRRAIDGRIYFDYNSDSDDIIGRIEEPDSLGISCQINDFRFSRIYDSVYSANYSRLPYINNGYFPFIFFQYSFPDTCGFEADFVLNDSINTAHWIWDFGDGSDPIIGVKRPKHTFSQPGIYSVKLKYTLKNGYADSVIREVRIQGFAPHYGFAERNLVACLGDTLTLKANWPADNYLWQNGETQPEITVTNNGTYHLATQAGNCVLSDSVEVSFKPKPTVYLGNDSTFCGRVSHTFDPVTNASRFKWNTGDTTRTLAVNEHGQYSLRVETEENCHNADTVLLFLETYPTAPFHSDTVVCGDIALLNAGNPNCTMLWNTGEQTQEIQVSTSGLYWVKIENEHCAIIDSINLTLIEFCDYHVHIPNTFTPNADGLNDCFSPTFINITSIDLKIYSRWGELIYQTDNKNDCWDGKHKGEACPAEVYFYTLQYQYETPFKTGLGNDKGMIHLVR